MSKFKITKGTLTTKEKDTIRIKNDSLNMSISVFSGKQGDFFLAYCPSLNISGYGKNEMEAEDFIKTEMEVFSEDVLGMTSDERENFLLSLGFKQERYKKKNFSKTYIDVDGKLQDFEEGTLERKTLEVA